METSGGSSTDVLEVALDELDEVVDRHLLLVERARCLIGDLRRLLADRCAPLHLFNAEVR